MSHALEPAEHTSAGLDQAWSEIGRAGGWFSGAQRLAIAGEARSARSCPLCRERKAAISPYSVEGDHQLDPTPPSSDHAPLHAATVDAIHRIATDPGRLSQQWYDALRGEAIEAEEVVEMTSIIAITSIADTLSRALSLPERPLPDAEAGEPARRSVLGTTLERGWVPMVEPDSAEGMTKMMYETVEAAAGFVFNVARALTSVPEALRDFFAAFFPNYSTHGPVRPGGLSRVQVELLASSTSAYNDCFY